MFYRCFANAFSFFLSVNRHLHSILPANGAPVTRQGTEHVRQLYEVYVRYNTMNDWKFWIVSALKELIV